jgi:hypothetical protein
MAKRFLIIFIPTCALAVGGVVLGIQQRGLWCVVGWIISVVFGIAALLQANVLIGELIQIGRAEQRLLDLERRDAELIAQGKSFDEIASQYRKPEH